MSRNEFAIVGAGAIGAIIAAHLARSGHGVTVLARGARARQVQEDGLRITGLSEISTPVNVVTDPSQLRETGTLIIATKTPGSEETLEQLRHVKLDMAFSIQNGVQKNELLSRTFGADRTLGALANTSGELLASGEVLFTRNANLTIGELTGGTSERATKLAKTIDDSGVRSSVVPDIVVREWTKFACWVGFVNLALTTRVVTGRFLSEPDAALLVVRLVREVAQLATAQGIKLTDDQALLPLRIVLDAPEAQAIEAVQKVGATYQSASPDHRMSALQDLLAGRRLEVKEILGFAVRKAAGLRVPMPLLETFHHIAGAIDRTRD